MSYGLLVLRLVLGPTIAAHGAQKLFGWFGGPGLRGAAGFFGSLGFRHPLLMALAAGACELGGGLFLAGGLLLPAASAAIVVVMLDAIATVHLRKGFWNANGGYELNLLIVAVAVAVALAATGGGRFSLDALVGWDGALHGLWWGVAALAIGAAVSAVTLTGRDRPLRPEEQPQEPSADRLRRAA